MRKIRKFILDTDLGPDCDDCGALAILDRYHKEGRAELLGITHCTSDRNSINVIAAINEWFGVDVPIGQTDREGFLADPAVHMRYTKPLSEAYLTAHAPAKFESAVPLMRRLLAEHRDVTLVFIGPLNNMSELLQSRADEASPLDGTALVKQSVSSVVIMGGFFAPPHAKEFNIECDVPAARYTAAHCPVPLLFCGFEAGINVITGASLAASDAAYPVREAYRLYLENSFLRPSWDLVTVYYALEPQLDGWIVSEACDVRFGGDGSTAIADGAGARYVKYVDEAELTEILNRLIVS